MIKIALCFDANYMHMALAVVRSVLDFHNKDDLTFFFIVDMSDTDLQALKEELSTIGVAYHVACVDPENFKNLSTKGHITRAAFMRLELDRTFPELDKVLYLDSDLIVTSSLSQIWNMDLTQKPLAAVANAGKDGSKRLGLSSNHVYFNSGVLLLDLNYFRENNIRERAYKWLEENNSSRAFHDQDAFNVLYEDKAHTLPKRFNMQAFWFRFFFSANQDLQDEIAQEFKQCGVVHFSSGRKPWQKGDMHPMKETFLKYYKGNILESENSIKEHMKRMYLFFYYWRVKSKLGLK